jgi:L-arabinonolactonase
MTAQYIRRTKVKAEVVVSSQAAHGEGVFWSAEHQLLYWTDMFGQCVWTYAPDRDEANKWPTPGKVCCFAARLGRPWNEVVAAFSDGFAFVDLLTGDRKDIAKVGADIPGHRLNDGRTDRQGRFLAGGMDEKTFKPCSSVWRLDPDLRVEELFTEVGIANGACFSPDGRTYYFADSQVGEIEAFNYDTETGRVSGRRTIARTAAPGAPDGSCVDAEGFVWNAVWDGYRVARYAPDGRLDRTIDVPVRKPSCCAFGGRDLATLYIITSRSDESAEDLAARPTSGDLFAVRPGVVGLADAPFAG